MFCGANVRIIFHSASVVTIFFTCNSIIFTLFRFNSTICHENTPKAVTFGVHIIL